MKASSQKIVLIGAGNLATQLGLALSNAGHSIIQVCSKSISSASILAKKLKCASINQPSKVNPTADIYIISVPDDNIIKVVCEFNFNDKIVVHTSGNTPIESIQKASKNTGVFYPLQTFSKNRIANFENIPLCIEASNKKSLTKLLDLAKSISNNVQNISSDERKTIHLAAVFACNFSNHFYGVAEDLLKNKKLSLDILKPLILETANKISHNHPKDMQTGPAIRKDKKTLQNHIDMLEDAELKKLYKLISKRISTTY